MSKSPKLRVKEILEKELYATIATSDLNCRPWNSPVYICFDEEYTFYWSSAKDSQHSLNIVDNENVFLVIFDSCAPWGEGEGVYIKARAREITDKDEISKAIELRFNRAGQGRQEVADFVGEAPRRMYKAVPQNFWINRDVTDDSGEFVKDSRLEVEF
jgi:general stress protein 26